MKVLILSCSTGGGHNAAGQAVLEELTRRGIPCEFLDALRFAGKTVSRKVSGSYSFITTKAPGLFRMLYSAGRAISRSDHRSPVYLANRLYGRQLHDYIRSGGFDLAVTPHLFPAQTLTHLREKCGLSLPCVAIATDYTCIPFWEETALDSYIVPHPDVVGEFAEKGVPREKLLPMGIPVRRAFREPGGRAAARRALGIQPDGPVYLLMSGSMGFGRLDALARALLSTAGSETGIVILCGNNLKARKRLAEQFAAYPNVSVRGFTKRPELYMDACDVLFTKPGGLTSTEAAVRGIPLIHTNPIPGCETQNARFFSARGLSFYDEDPVREAEAAIRLAHDGEARARMLKAQREQIPAGACEAICDYLCTLVR